MNYTLVFVKHLMSETASLTLYVEQPRLVWLKQVSTIYPPLLLVLNIWTWNNRLVPNRKRSTSRLYTVTPLFNLDAEYIMRNAGLEEAQAGIKIAGRNINNVR